MRSERWAADGPLMLLSIVALAVVGGLGAFVAGHTLPFDPLVACRTMAATWIARVSTVGTLLPLGVIGVVLLSGLLALAHQLWATRRMLLTVLAARRPLTPRLRWLADSAGIVERLDLVADEAAYTFCYGLVWPRVCVSSGLTDLLTDEELLAVLQHERHHLRHRDPLKILFSRTLASGLSFLPLSGALHDSYLAGKEICADADATAESGELPLAGALVKLLAAERPVWPAGVLAVGAFSPTEARLKHLVEPGVVRPLLPSAVDWIVSLALVAGIFGFSYGSAAAGQVEPINTACAPEITLGELVAPPEHLPVTVPDSFD